MKPSTAIAWRYRCAGQFPARLLPARSRASGRGRNRRRDRGVRNVNRTAARKPRCLLQSWTDAGAARRVLRSHRRLSQSDRTTRRQSPVGLSQSWDMRFFGAAISTKRWRHSTAPSNSATANSQKPGITSASRSRAAATWTRRGSLSQGARTTARQLSRHPVRAGPRAD